MRSWRFDPVVISSSPTAWYAAIRGLLPYGAFPTGSLFTGVTLCFSLGTGARKWFTVIKRLVLLNPERPSKTESAGANLIPDCNANVGLCFSNNWYVSLVKNVGFHFSNPPPRNVGDFKKGRWSGSDKLEVCIEGGLGLFSRLGGLDFSAEFP